MSHDAVSSLPTPTFWEFFHSLLRRQSGSESEVIRAKNCCDYLLQNEIHLRKVVSEAEAQMLSVVKHIFLQTGEAPRYASVRSHIASSEGAKLEEILEDYEAQMKELEVHDHLDLPALVVRLDNETRTTTLLREVEVIKKIATTGVTIQKGGKSGPKTRLHGATDAIMHLYKRLDATSLVPNQGRVRGSLKSNSADLRTIYGENSAHEGGRISIPTGLINIDSKISFKRGHFVGILGFAGMRKTSLARSWVYNAASLGFRVMHITFEQSYDEEMAQYAIMHSHHPKWGNEYNLTIKNFDEGSFGAREERFLFSTVLPDLQNLPGDIIIEQPTGGGTWENVKSMILRENMRAPLDMVVIDYLTLCTPKNFAAAKEEMNEIIKDAKNLALTFNDGRGLLLVTPVQGNREGKDFAAKNDGQWDMSGVYLYSEFDKSVDVMLTVYLDDDLKTLGEVVVGTAKSRRSDTIAPFRAGVHPAVGRILHLETSAATSSMTVMADQFLDPDLAAL